jgi:hypothetical protein
MKNFILLCISSICFYAASQDSSTVLISEININNPDLNLEISNQPVKGKPKKDTVWLKLKEIEDLVRNLELRLKDSLTKTLKGLPSMVNEEQQARINSLTIQNEKLIQQKENLEKEKAYLITEKNSADAKLNSQKNEFENEITKLNKEKTKAETDKNSVLLNKSSEWEAYAKIYLKNEKFISADLLNKMKVQISSNATLTSDLETFQIQSKRLAVAEDFLYVGKGDLKTVHTDFKNIIDATKYPEQANAQKELQAMFDLFFVLAKEFNAMLGPIKDVSESIRKSEIDNWRYFRIAVNFPYLKAVMQKNYKSHSPIEL